MSRFICLIWSSGEGRKVEAEAAEVVCSLGGGFDLRLLL